MNRSSVLFGPSIVADPPSGSNVNLSPAPAVSLSDRQPTLELTAWVPIAIWSAACESLHIAAPAPTAILDVEMYVVKQQSGRYETVDSLSDGAMGSVTLARDRLLDRFVAVKTVKLDGVLDPDERKRLQEALVTEVQVVQLLSHPNIVAVHDVIHQPGDPAPSLVMEYVQGSTLESFLKGGHPLPTDFTLSIAAQVAHGLEHAHSMGVIHGDIKPGNILICDDGEQAKIVDFGIARLAGTGAEPADRIYGTPRYVSPEQILGQKADQRSDLFSLGVVLYEMLTGHSPFQGATSEEITREVARGAADFSSGALQGVPESLQAVLRRALAHDPGERYQNAGELARVLADPEQGSSSADTVATQDLTALVVPEIPELEADSLPGEVPATVASAATTEPPAGAGHYSLSQEEPVPWIRWALIALLAAVPTLVIGLLVIWFATPEAPPDARFSEMHLLQAQVLPLFKEGRRQALEGEPEVAIRLYRRAQGVVPPSSDVAKALRRAEQDAIQQQAIQEKTAEFEDLLTETRRALDTGNHQSARRLATQALSLEPEDPEAQALLDAAGSGRNRSKQPTSPPVAKQVSPASPNREPETSVERSENRASAVARRTPPETSAPPPPAPRPKPQQVAVSGTANLRVDVFSYLSKGILTVYAGEDQVLLEPFKFVQKSGFMRRKKTAGRLETSVVIPSGSTEFRIYVSADGQETQTVNLAADLVGGQTHVLRLIIAENGSASAQLN